MPQEDDQKPESVCADKKCQATKCYKKIDKNSQTNVMGSVTRSSNKKLIGSAKDKNCQATISYKKQKKCEYDDFESQTTVKMYSDKNFQGNINMWPVMPEMNVQNKYRRLCSNKNCQSARC